MLSVGRVMEQSALTSATAPKSSEQVSEKKSTTLAAESTDKFVKSGVSFTPAYTKATVTDNRSGTTNTSTMPDSNHEISESAQKKAEEADQQKTKVNENNVPQFKSVTEAKNELMKDMVKQMLSGQFDESHKTGAMKELEEILSSFSDEEEHGEEYWGAEQTANRIMDFAKALAGDDDESFDILKNAFETAFSESEKLFGGKGGLPTVSYDTYDRVQNGFEDWSNEIAKKREAAQTQQQTTSAEQVETVATQAQGV